MARPRITLWWVAPIVAVAVAGGVVAGMTIGHRSTSPPSSLAAARTARTARTTTGTARTGGAVPTGTTTAPPTTSGGTGTTSAGTGTTSGPPAVVHHRRKARHAAPLQLVATTPAPKAVAVASSGTITVRFSAPLAASSPTPSLSPSTQGTWQVHGSAMTFTPTVPFLPLSDVTLKVPAGATGVRGATGGVLRRAYSSSFTVQTGSIFRLDQLLSLLDYSPLAWTPAGGAIPPGDTAAQVRALYKAPPGHFAWRQAGWPVRLTGLWSPGRYNVMLRGLVMSFQADHGLIPNGDIGPGLWNDLVAALAHHVVNTGGYNFAIASKVLPESLTIWHDGKVVLHAPANTGISVDPTHDGVFPVYSRLRNQVMRGTNPDGSHYADPVQYVAYFNGGDAVHYIPRADYGVPQSLGCVELSLSDAARAWPWLAYGTLVDVIG